MKTLIVIIGLIIGAIGGYVWWYVPPSSSLPKVLLNKQSSSPVIGFLPYWLIDTAQDDYSPYITTLTYFGLTLGPDGGVLTNTSPQEREPGWYALSSGKANSYLSSSRKSGITLSLLVFMADEEHIQELVSNPVKHAQNMMDDVAPLMKKHGFRDINLDIESVTEASSEAQLNFARFVAEVRTQVDERKLGTVTIDIAPDALVRKRLIDIASVADSVDYVVLMGYDYHYMGSMVTGPVAPLGGAGIISEYDTMAAVNLLRVSVPDKKIILGIPLYGYEWESLRGIPRAAVLPGSGLTASTRRIEELISSCQNCTQGREEEADEAYVIYRNEDTDMYHQFFYPDQESMRSKIDYVNQEHLGGIALWALGYESSDLMEPLQSYRQ
ncbi:MAG: glycosyl hydrolase family 18 protein [Candidatus Roizmanbacteria bacterium]|nr:glycosyl hydrolase family 18 protein [Candidatus Roizmanbacteria bacterium]